MNDLTEAGNNRILISTARAFKNDLWERAECSGFSLKNMSLNDLNKVRTDRFLTIKQ